jgi:glycosyltransferase involved in cell wall biosynthesis
MRNIARVCFVVHRYPPYIGGSEYYSQQMAEECLSRGIETTVVTKEHAGDLNGVKITSDLRELQDKDLLVIHGGNPIFQGQVLQNLKDINSPSLYLLIEPSDSTEYIKAMDEVDFVGCSSPEDWEHVRRWKVEEKSHKVVHGISPKSSVGLVGVFKDKYGIPKNKRMFLSCGGYWPNKRMVELADAFKESGTPNAVLVTTGYDGRFPECVPTKSNSVFPLMIEDPQDIKNAMADAECYILNSSQEGFGLVILESMINRTPWVARNIAGAKLLSDFGQVYESKEDLVKIIKEFSRNGDRVEEAYQYVMKNHLIKNTIDDILVLLK